MVTPEFAWLPPKEAIAAPQVCYRHCYASFPFPGVTKGDTFTDAGQSLVRDRCRHSVSLQAIANHECLYHKTSKPRPRLLKRIFMPSGAPPAHEKIVINVTKMVAAGVSQL